MDTQLKQSNIIFIEELLNKGYKPIDYFPRPDVPSFLTSFASIEELYPLPLKSKFLDFNSGVGNGNVSYLAHFVFSDKSFEEVLLALSNTYAIESNPLLLDHNKYVILAMLKKFYPEEFDINACSRIISKNFKCGDGTSFSGFSFKFNLVIGTFFSKNSENNSFLFLNSLLGMRKKGGLGSCFVPNDFGSSQDFSSYRKNIASELLFFDEHLSDKMSFFSALNSTALKDKVIINGECFSFSAINKYKEFVMHKLSYRSWSDWSITPKQTAAESAF